MLNLVTIVRMRFRATVVKAPEFELPDYKRIPAATPDTDVTEAEVDAAVERLREQSADFVDVPERGLEMEDFAVIDFAGTIEGKPIAEIAPARARICRAGKNSGCGSRRTIFCRLFVEQMLGQKPNETRTVKVEFPADFPGDRGGGQNGRVCRHVAGNQTARPPAAR